MASGWFRGSRSQSDERLLGCLRQGRSALEGIIELHNLCATDCFATGGEMREAGSQ